MGLSAWPFNRYSRCRPSSRTATAPTSRSTRRCLDTCGCDSPSVRTRSFTGRSPPTRASRICRRRGSATALNASVVVAARAMAGIIYRYGYMSTGQLVFRRARPGRDAAGQHAEGLLAARLVDHLAAVERGAATVCLARRERLDQRRGGIELGVAGREGLRQRRDLPRVDRPL